MPCYGAVVLRLDEERRRWWTLAALCFALFMIVLDNTVVNVALPAIQRELDVGLSQLEWIVNAYALTFAVLLLTGGKLADYLGRRRVLLVGLTIFTVSSLACGLATSGGMLIGARAVQGVGAALMMPATLSLVSATFPPSKRGTAIGIWVSVSASALALGPLAGGLLTEHVAWSWIFFVNVPVGVAGFVAGRLLIRESRDTSEEQQIDLPGLLTSGAALFALAFALIEGNRYGWTSAPILALLAVAAAGLLAFVLVERRARAPMLDLSLFRSRTFAGANLVALLVMLAMFGVFFFMSLYMQWILGFSALEAGATFVPMTLVIAVVAPLAGKLADRVGARWIMVTGMTLVSLSLVVNSRLDASSGFWDIVPGLLVAAFGMPLTMTPLMTAALGSVPVAKSGVASGVIQTSRQVGVALGVAVMGAVMSAVGGVVGAGARPAAFVEGFSAALLVAAAIALGGALCAALTIEPLRAQRAALAEAPS